MTKLSRPHLYILQTCLILIFTFVKEFNQCFYFDCTQFCSSTDCDYFAASVYFILTTGLSVDKSSTDENAATGQNKRETPQTFPWDGEVHSTFFLITQMKRFLKRVAAEQRFERRRVTGLPLPPKRRHLQASVLTVSGRLRVNRGRSVLAGSPAEPAEPASQPWWLHLNNQKQLCGFF